MCKGYVKENGKWKLVEKQETKVLKEAGSGAPKKEGPVVLVNQKGPVTLEELSERLRKVEALLFSTL